MQWHKMRGRTAVLLGSCLAATALGGCSTSRMTEAQPSAAVIQQEPPPGRPIALQHFIDGSIYEMKGEYAKAVLEFQDALRYEPNHAIYFALSKDYSILGKHDLAIETGREALRLEPSNLDYRRSLAEVYVAAFDLDSAAAQYREVIREDSSDVTAWYSLARIYQTRSPEQALDVYEGLIARFGPDWDVLLQIADLCNKLEKFSQAANALQQMAVIDPGNRELKRSLAQALVRAGELDSAMGVYKELRDGNPEDLEYEAEIGGIELQQKKYDRAAADFNPILSRDTVALTLKLHIGEMYFGQLGKDSTLAPAVEAVFDSIRSGHPEDWRAYWFLGAVGSVIHDDSMAVRNFRTVTELASWNADAWVYLSSVFLEKNDFTQVAAILESAVRVLPDDFRVNFLLGVAYSRLSRDTDAVRLLERAHEIDPKNLDAISQLALVYDTMKKFDDSDSLYEEALRLDPRNHLVLNNYSYSLADRGVQLERALSMAGKALEAQPDNASYLDTMGWVYFRLGRYHQAEDYVRKSIQKGEGNAVVFEHLGDIYFKLNDRRRAIEQWENAWKLDQKNTALHAKIERGSL